MRTTRQKSSTLPESPAPVYIATKSADVDLAKKQGTFPGETALVNNANMSPRRAAAKNVHGYAHKKQLMYELRRELKKENIKKHGLGTNPLANMHFG